MLFLKEGQHLVREDVEVAECLAHDQALTIGLINQRAIPIPREEDRSDDLVIPELPVPALLFHAFRVDCSAKTKPEPVSFTARFAIWLYAEAVSVDSDALVGLEESRESRKGKRLSRRSQFAAMEEIELEMQRAGLRSVAFAFGKIRPWNRLRVKLRLVQPGRHPHLHHTALVNLTDDLPIGVLKHRGVGSDHPVKYYERPSGIQLDLKIVLGVKGRDEQRQFTVQLRNGTFIPPVFEPFENQTGALRILAGTAGQRIASKIGNPVERVRDFLESRLRLFILEPIYIEFDGGGRAESDRLHARPTAEAV